MENTLIVLLQILTLIQNSQAGYQWTSWSKPSDCSTTCGQGISTKIRECKPVDETSVREGANDCAGPATIEEACFMSPCPNIDHSLPCNCGCKLMKDNGRIVSRLNNKESFCLWSIHTKPGSMIVLTINRVKNFDWKSGGLYISGKGRAHRFTEQFGDRMDRTFPIVIYTKGNEMNLTLHYFGRIIESKNVEMEASYTINEEDSSPVGVKENSEDEESELALNYPAIAGISACAFIILVASIIIACRKFHNSSGTEKKEDEKAEEGMEDNCSSISGSNRSAYQRQPKVAMNSNAKSCYSTPYSTGTLSTEERDRLLSTQNNEYCLKQDGSALSSIPATGYVVPSGQSFVNWPVQNGQIIQPTVQMMSGQTPVAIPQQALDYMIKQTQLNYARHLSVDTSNAVSYEYVTSGGES